MPITSLDGVIAGMPGQFFHISKSAKTGVVAGSYISTWLLPGQPGPGANPGSANGVVPTSATAGTIVFTNPTSPAISYLSKFAGTSVNGTTYMLYDRLWANSTLSGILTTAQTITQPALTRPDSVGTDTELWLEIYTPTGATPVTATASYTNSAGTAGKSATASLIASPVAGQMIPFALASGDTGVRSVQSVTLSATTGTAGDFGLTINRRVATLGFASGGIGDTLNIFSLGMPRIYDNACLALLCNTSTTTTGQIFFELQIIQG